MVLWRTRRSCVLSNRQLLGARTELFGMAAAHDLRRQVCFLASSAYSASQPVETSVFSSVTAEALRVVASIWNNGVGTAIPSVSQDLVPSTSHPSGTQISATATGGIAAGLQTAAADRSNAAGRVSGRSAGGRAALVAAAGAVVIAVLLAA
ncbi:hypothetical protein JCM10296v2_006815 [Rhodotorula toruloides]